MCDYGVWRNKIFRVRRIWVTIRPSLDSFSSLSHTHIHAKKKKKMSIHCLITRYTTWGRYNSVGPVHPVIYLKSTLLWFTCIRTCCIPSMFTTCWWNNTGVYCWKAALLQIYFHPTATFLFIVVKKKKKNLQEKIMHLLLALFCRAVVSVTESS